MERLGTRGIVIFTLALGGCMAAPDAAPAVRVEAMIGAADDVSGISVSQRRRDASVFVGGRGACSGTLVTPRLVATAWHCSSPTGVVGFGSETPRTDLTAVGCIAFPGARNDGVIARCADTLTMTIEQLDAVSGSRDIALFVLAERIDDHPVFRWQAVPAPAVLVDPGGDPDGWIGTTLRQVGWTTPNTFRQVGTGEVISVLPIGGFEIDPTFGENGDSGGGGFVGDPDTAPMALLGVWRGGTPGGGGPARYFTRTTDPEVRDWISPLLVGNWGSWYLGPADRAICAPPTCTPDPFGPDPDGDGLDSRHDGCPNVYDPRQADQDMDGIGNVCDNCPSVSNHDQADCDEDGQGDACASDSDGDGVPNGCDNCVEVANAAQYNCNIEGELVASLPDVLGDACDPSSCTRGGANTIASSPGTYATHIQGYGVSVDRNDLGITGRGTASTGFRWCPCASAHPENSPEWRAECADPLLGSGCVVDADEYVNLGSPWKEMTLTHDRPAIAGRIELDYDAPPELDAETDSVDRFSSVWNMPADATSAGVLITHSFGGITHREARAVYPFTGYPAAA